MSDGINDALGAILGDPSLMASLTSAAQKLRSGDAQADEASGERFSADEYDRDNISSNADDPRGDSIPSDGDNSYSPISRDSSAGDVSTGDSANAPLSGVLTPELLMQLPNMLKAASPLLEKFKPRGRPGGGSHSFKQHEKLLSALKPYLNGSRREALELLVSFAGIAEAFGINKGEGGDRS